MDDTLDAKRFEYLSPVHLMALVNLRHRVGRPKKDQRCEKVHVVRTVINASCSCLVEQ